MLDMIGQAGHAEQAGHGGHVRHAVPYGHVGHDLHDRGCCGTIRACCDMLGMQKMADVMGIKRLLELTGSSYCKLGGKTFRLQIFLL